MYGGVSWEGRLEIFWFVREFYKLVATVTKLGKTRAIQWFTFDIQLQIALSMTETRRKM